MVATAALCWGHGAILGQAKNTYLDKKVSAASAYSIIILERAVFRISAVV